LRRGQIRLRPFKLSDASAVADACRDPLIPKYTFMKEGLTEEEAVQWIERGLKAWDEGHARFAIVEDGSDEVIGQVGIGVDWSRISAEAYYWVRSSHRRLGAASTALTLLSRWALDELRIERLHLLTHLDNDASQAVATRCGFTREGVLRGYEPFKGTRPDLVSWSLLPNDLTGHAQ
jgi:RimJ/RimL family protein N-acetyltransferase